MGELYLAYGSNMDEAQMSVRCPGAKLVGKTMVSGYQLLFKGSDNGVYATIEPEEQGCLPALVWEIPKKDEQNLDKYERFPELYHKDRIEVAFNGKLEMVMVYIMNPDQKNGVPDKAYYEVIMHAYQKFGFQSEILENAYKISKTRQTYNRFDK